ncbi:hypothetical protein BDF14DRAFT_1748273 [Spinellus fusiger]|nr:hypothetical protein BDF14DRAFT_1748273 [Spinellus fusiger]
MSKNTKESTSSESCFQLTSISSIESTSMVGRSTDTSSKHKSTFSMGTLSSFPIIQETPKRVGAFKSQLSSTTTEHQTMVRHSNDTKRTLPSELKFKIESIGTQPEEDDDIELCPARIRPSWPDTIVTWWKPSQPREKPPYSYATLIAHAILSSKDGRLTLSDIYRWISTHYPYFTLGRRGWQNSIRHNLSLNKKWFVKLDRRPTQANPGKGCYWTLLSGTEKTFIENLTQAGGHSRKHHDIGLTAELSASHRRGSCFYAPTTTTTTTDTVAQSSLMVCNTYFASTHMFITRPEDYENNPKANKSSSLHHPTNGSTQQDSGRQNGSIKDTPLSVLPEKSSSRASMYSTFRMTDQSNVQERKKSPDTGKKHKRSRRRKQSRTMEPGSYDDSEYDSGVDVSNEYISGLHKRQKKSQPVDTCSQDNNDGSLVLEDWQELLNVGIEQLQESSQGCPSLSVETVNSFESSGGSCHPLEQDPLLDYALQSQPPWAVQHSDWFPSFYADPLPYTTAFPGAQSLYPTLLASHYEPGAEQRGQKPSENAYADVLQELFHYQQQQQSTTVGEDKDKSYPVFVDLNDEITAKYLHFENDSVQDDEEQKWTPLLTHPLDGTFIDACAHSHQPPLLSPNTLASVQPLADYCSMTELLYS